MKDQKINLNYILWGCIIVLFTWLLHEFSHWVVSEILGYDTTLRLNATSPVQGSYKQTEDHILISIAGPIITIFQAVLAYILLKPQWNKALYLLLFTPFYMRALAGFMNFINLNDEGRISAYLAIGTFTLPVLVSVFLFYLVYRASAKSNLGWKFQLGTTLIVMFFSSILILADQVFKITLI